MGGFIGANRIKDRAKASQGKGLRAKEQQRIRPRRFGGAEAAIEMPIGPEKDSARR